MAVCNNIIIYAYQAHLNDNDPSRLMVLDTQKVEELGIMALLEELCHWGLGL